MDFVLFWHKACAKVGVGIRAFRTSAFKVPSPNDIDFTLPQETDPFAPIFRNAETGANWSLNDLWHQVQEATDPFDGVVKGQPPVFRTACFPYPGTVIVETTGGPCVLGDVLLTVALWIEAERVSLDAAQKVEYSANKIPAIQRVEFASRRRIDWRSSLQIPKESIDITDLRTGGNWPVLKL
jgi:hypothetical protein